MAIRVQFRRGTAADWAAANPALAVGEPGVETDTGVLKLGDGASAWSVLSRFLRKSDADALYAPIAARSCRVYRQGATGNQNVPNGVVTYLNFDAEDFDSNAMHDTAVNNSRIVLNKVGLWRVTASIEYGNPTSAAGIRQAGLSLNGGARGTYTSSPPTSAVNFHSQQVTTEWRTAAVTDYVEAYAYQNSGGAMDANAGIDKTWFCATYIAA